ncbi:MAG: permease [Hyphomicrobiales bacterium]|nr:YeeE/YedE family protein [Hyphomicrobiales bacterium]PCH50879.1 MAG: permease [Hyphomicrobiales bacterium]PCH50976.1 MAG: permease [Hyphomicrobiales bacterium]
MRFLITYLIGLVFGTGIMISGMANPAKVLNFFDVAGSWDPSLALVMGGALLVTFFGYRWSFSRAKPLFANKFSIPTRKDLDTKLIGGSMIFGIGWALAGFCPGGALPAIGTGKIEVFIFIASLVAGIYSTKLARLSRKIAA